MTISKPPLPNAHHPLPPPSVLTMGEPAGIGPEITLKAWRFLKNAPPEDTDTPHRHPVFFVIGDPDLYRTRSRDCNIDADIIAIDDPHQAHAVFPDALPVLGKGYASVVVRNRYPAVSHQKMVIKSITQGFMWAKKLGAPLITNPIHKATLYEAGFDYPGHTQMLGDLSKVKTPVMMLANSHLRVVPVTTHIALKDVTKHLHSDILEATMTITAMALNKDFSIPRPRIAVAALNPHAGENGTMGLEEQTIISPAIARIKERIKSENNAHIDGPLPADTLFYPDARRAYDAVICMYHDQALIPLKTLDFKASVNITLGLDIVRTSPGHGTALDIAASNRADSSSLIEAIRTAHRLSMHRCQTDP